MPKASIYCAQEVEAKFEKYGPVKEARIVRNPVNGESRGFGFVAMKYEEDVDSVRIFATGILPGTQVCSAALESVVRELHCVRFGGPCMQAIRTLDGAEWQGRRLGVERARNVKYAFLFLPSLHCVVQQLAHDERGLSRVVLQPS